MMDFVAQDIMFGYCRNVLVVVIVLCNEVCSTFLTSLSTEVFNIYVCA